MHHIYTALTLSRSTYFRNFFVSEYINRSYSSFIETFSYGSCVLSFYMRNESQFSSKEAQTWWEKMDLRRSSFKSFCEKTLSCGWTPWTPVVIGKLQRQFFTQSLCYPPEQQRHKDYSVYSQQQACKNVLLRQNPISSIMFLGL